MDAHNLTVVICPNLVSSPNPMRDVMMCSVPNAPTLFDATRAASSTNLPATQQQPPPTSLSTPPSEGKTTLGMVIKLCIQRYYEVFDEVPDRSEALVQEIARPRHPFTAADTGSPGSPGFANRDSALLEDDDIDDAMLVMPLGPGNRSSLGNGNGASGSTFRPAHRTNASRDATARSTHTAVGGGGPPSAYATVNQNRARSTISIERGSQARKGSIALRGAAGTGKSAGAGVQALGITAAGFFSAPDAPPVPLLPSQVRQRERELAQGGGNGDAAR